MPGGDILDMPVMRPAPRADSAVDNHDWLAKAIDIVDRWELVHQRRLLGTTDAARLAGLIADGLEAAYEDGRSPSPSGRGPG